MILSSSALIWAGFGLVLMIAEMLTGTFVLLSFGISALIVALFAYAGLENNFLQIVVFAVDGLTNLWIFKKVLPRRQQTPSLENDSGVQFTLDNTTQGMILPKEEGSVFYQGSPWTAFNTGDTPLKAGDRVRIVKTEGIKLVITKA